MTIRIIGLSAACIAATLALAACGTQRGQSTAAGAASAVASAVPEGVLDRGDLVDPDPIRTPVVSVFPAEPTLADMATGTAVPTIIDTRAFERQIVAVDPGRSLRVKDFLPVHTRPEIEFGVPAEDADPGAFRLTAGEPRVDPASLFQFSTISNTGWNPPDPTLAVGPEHVVVTVNSSVAFHTRSGQLLFQQSLQGFFSSVGAGSFVFDPKVFYDVIDERYVIVALEVYDQQDTAYIDLAVSDDDDPLGVWYRYRMDARTLLGDGLYWWDYPGFGYEDDAVVVSCNLFGLNVNGFGGVGYRVIRKAEVYNGQPILFNDFVQTDAASMQGAQNLTPGALGAFFVGVNTAGSLRLTGVRFPESATPFISTTFVAVPTIGAPPLAQTAGGGLVDLVGDRIMNAIWRDGRLYATQAVGIEGGARSALRWYELGTGNFPFTPAISVEQFGTVIPENGKFGFFPAIAANADGDIGLLYGVSSPTLPTGIEITARNADDPEGEMGQPQTVYLSPRTFSGINRWGDYFDLAVDPLDDNTFWGIGETFESFGWDNRVVRFSLFNDPACPADINGDGVLSFSDVTAFIDAFNGLAADADVNGDGSVSFADVTTFIDSFNTGCP